MAEEKSGATSGSSVLENIAVVLLQNKLSVIIVVTLFVCLSVCLSAADGSYRTFST